MKQTNIYTASLAALMLILAGCSDEQYTAALATGQQPGSGASGPLITVTATQGDRPQTRLGYDDPNDPTKPIAVTWAAGDKFYVGKDFSAFTGSNTYLSTATAYFSPFALRPGCEGSKSAEFTGNKPGGVAAGDPLYAFYGDGAGRIALEKGTLSFDYTNQRQSANDNKDHLSAVDFMVATTTETGRQPVFAFTRLGAMMKFNITMPTESMTVKQLTLTTTDESAPFSSSAQWDKTGALAFSKSKTASASITLLLGTEETGITLTDKTLTAYMMVAPTTLTTETSPIAGKRLKLQVTAADGVVYKATLKGANIEQGTYYTVEAEPSNYDEMDFTIRVDAENGLNYQMVFDPNYRFPCDVTVNWGDETEVLKLPANTLVTDHSSNLKHNYAAAGEYTITITSAQTDATQKQIPPISFKNVQDENAQKKLISMNSPILNSGSDNFQSYFSQCINLKSLPAGLFDKNPLACFFQYCFKGCTSLKSLPAGLFDKNLEAKVFEQCFYGCTSLESLPDGLFRYNTEAQPQDANGHADIWKDFEKCFQGCTSLKSLPDELFLYNTKAKYFNSCFQGCTNLTSIGENMFGTNAQAKDFSYCFQGCTSLANLPYDMFQNVKQATTYRSCFQDCTSLVELPDLFVNAIQATNFSYCFQGCTSLAKLPDALFNYATKATNFSYCFDGCTSLKESFYPLFGKNLEATNFSYCFRNCTNLYIEEELFGTIVENHGYLTDTSRFKNKIINFESCFENASSGPDFRPGSNYEENKVPNLWSFTQSDTGFSIGWTTTNCFKGCKAMNLNDFTEYEWGKPGVYKPFL